MTTVEMVWVVTLSVAVMCAVADMFVAWLNTSDWKGAAVEAIVSQWIVLFSMALILSLILRGKG